MRRLVEHLVLKALCSQTKVLEAARKYFVEGKPLRVVAEEVGVSKGTVRSWLNAIKRAARYSRMRELDRDLLARLLAAVEDAAKPVVVVDGGELVCRICGARYAAVTHAIMHVKVSHSHLVKKIVEEVEKRVLGSRPS